jgi:PAS domain S-box-containing protein
MNTATNFLNNTITGPTGPTVLTEEQTEGHMVTDDLSFDLNSNDVPLCMATLCRGDAGGCYVVTRVNQAFEKSIGPLYKLKESNFLELVSRKDHQSKLLDAIESVLKGECSSKRVRNIEMTTLAEIYSGLPMKQHCDWTVAKGQDKQLLLFGDLVTERDAEQRAKDADLVDFFQNAPIALHWLSGEGIVLWANQTELDVLGYTAEEYIGQPIMNFCPDEQELVLEIFKQLGSGSTIRDVPVRFRSKAGKIVNLLIDSNVKRDDDGNFEHTRCFIRDDTHRKISEAQAQLLLEETKRSLTMLDNFMSRSMHHMRTPLHVLQSSMDIVSNNLTDISTSIQRGDGEMAKSLAIESQSVLDQAGTHVLQATDMIDDVTELARLDQGQELKIRHESIDLRELGQEIFADITVPDNVEAALELTGGPSFIFSDKRNLKKVLRHLLDHVLCGAQGDEKRTVLVEIGQVSEKISFAVIDSLDYLSSNEIRTDGNTPPGACGDGDSEKDTQLPLIFQRYHQELVPDNTLDFEAAGNLRDKIEMGVNSHRINSIGIGLSLSHHLVQTLGGDLRYSTRPGMTKFWFALPQSERKIVRERIVLGKAKVNSSGNQRSNFVQEVKEVRREVPLEQIALCGLKALDSTSVLVVEDTPMCAKLLCNTLRQLKCSSTWADNGSKALDLLRKDSTMFDLILMDIRMPVMDGLTATKLIRDELKISIPVVALTGDTSIDLKEQCEKIGFDDFCNKPLKRQDLMRIIETHTTKCQNF